MPGVLDTLNPLLSRTAAARAVAALAFPGLVARRDGRFAPSLAANWSTSDGLTWTFHMDRQRRWQDGAAVTSADVAYTLGLVRAADSPVDPAIRQAWQGIHDVAPDADTVILTVTANVGATVLDLATLPILPAHLLAASPVSTLALLPFSSHPVGSGSYRVVAADSQSATLALAAPDDLAPRRVVIAMTSGISDTMTTVATPSAANVEPAAGSVRLMTSGDSAAGAAVVSAALARPIFVFLNIRDATLSDVRVRQALNLAINRQTLIAGPLHAAAVALTGAFSPGQSETVGAADIAPPSVAAAAATLQQDSWVSGGTWRVRQGVPLAVTLLVDDDPGRLAVAQAIAGDWQAVGVQTTVEAVGLDGLLRDFAAPGRFQAALLGVQQRGALPDLATLWHSGGSLNISGWSDPPADAAIDATRAADRDTAHAGYLAFAQRFADQLPAIPLYLPTARYAVQGVLLPIGRRNTQLAINDPADILRNVAQWRAAP